MTTLVRRTQRPLLGRVFPDVDRLFQDLGVTPWAGWPFGRVEPVVWAPKVDVYEKDGELVLKFELPGVDRDHLEVTRENGHLIVRAETAKEEETDEGGYHRRERFHGHFERTVPLPAEVKDEEIRAKFEDGVLEIRAPKHEPEPAGRRIEVQ